MKVRYFAYDSNLSTVTPRSSEFADATRIIVSHATNDARTADKVVYLEDGEIKEVGSYRELLAQDNGFAALVAAEHGSTKPEDG